MWSHKNKWQSLYEREGGIEFLDDYELLILGQTGDWWTLSLGRGFTIKYISSASPSLVCYKLKKVKDRKNVLCLLSWNPVNFGKQHFNKPLSNSCVNISLTWTSSKSGLRRLRFHEPASSYPWLFFFRLGYTSVHSIWRYARKMSLFMMLAYYIHRVNCGRFLVILYASK